MFLSHDVNTKDRQKPAIIIMAVMVRMGEQSELNATCRGDSDGRRAPTLPRAVRLGPRASPTPSVPRGAGIVYVS